MGLLDGKVAIVTGAGRGIGRGEALELAREGARVVVNELDADAGAAVVLEVEELGGEAVLDTSDVADVDAARSMLQRAVDRWGALDALVNNAGVLRDRTIVNMTPEEWDTVIRVHLRGHYAPTHLACAYWKAEQRPGRIVCTSSTSGLLGNFGQTNYGTAKAGIAAFAQIVAMEMARYGVTCNAIAPAARTRMTESAYGSIGTDAADFDFWHGTWTVRNRRLQERLVGSDAWEEFPATASAWPILEGFGNADEFRTEHDGGFVGMSFRFFDPTTRRWSIYWADSRRPGLLDPPVIGSFTGDTGVFEGDDTFKGRPIRVRFIWSGVTTPTPRWEQAFSDDGGETWETNWVNDFTRTGGDG